MRNIFLLALGMAILMLSGCGVATPDTNEVSPPETKKEQPQMVKLGVIAHLS
ncbi:MAG: hypothetical protein LBG59_04145 [Candidatus Peribacteria bacterium]|jgi:uncharacterized lipoprotein YajG|nr:hypothetical protein [Candidatus Peribacteria bacterium]